MLGLLLFLCGYHHGGRRQRAGLEHQELWWVPAMLIPRMLMPGVTPEIQVRAKIDLDLIIKRAYPRHLASGMEHTHRTGLRGLQENAHSEQEVGFSGVPAVWFSFPKRRKRWRRGG